MQLHERLEAVSASRVDGPSKLVLIMLAKRLDRDDPNGVVWSSSETLAEECGVSTKAITRTMDRLTKAGIVRIVSKAAQGRSARKAIDWVALAAAERDAGTIENIPAEKRRAVGSRSDESSDLESTDRRTLERRAVDSRSDAPSQDPINDPSMNPIPESDPGTRSDAGEPDPDQQAEPEPPMPTVTPDSRPTTSTDPIDNDGALAPSPFRATPSPTDEVSDVPTACHPRPDVDDGHDVQPRPGRESAGVAGDGPDLGLGGVRARVAGGLVRSTLTAAPATTPATAPPPLAAPSVVAPNERQGGAGAFTLSPPSKPKGKRKAATEITEDQIASVAVFVDRIIGKPGRCLPGSTRWKRLTNAIKGAGLSKVYARMEATADAAEGKASPASETWKVMTSRGCTVDNMIWDHNGWTASIDTAIEDAAIDAAERASETTGAAGGVVGRLEPQNRSQGQAAPKQSGSGAWDDMLSVIRSTGGLRLSLGLKGSTLSHDPTEHTRRCRAVADIGGWAKLCEMGEHNRGIIRAQFVSAYERAGVTA